LDGAGEAYLRLGDRGSEAAQQVGDLGARVASSRDSSARTSRNLIFLPCTPAWSAASRRQRDHLGHPPCASGKSVICASKSDTIVDKVTPHALVFVQVTGSSAIRTVSYSRHLERPPFQLAVEGTGEGTGRGGGHGRWHGTYSLVTHVLATAMASTARTSSPAGADTGRHPPLLEIRIGGLR
jgi:hypothetical protein